jgi:arginine decarboxylase
MGPTGKAIFLTKGVGRHREKLTSFELALRDARIAEFNLVRVSSIFPPGCKVISIQDGLKTLTPGQIVYTVMYDNSTDEPHRLMATSVGLAIPADKDQYGYLSEHKSFGQTDERAGDYAEDLAATMLATALGVDFDPNVSYDERKDVWKLSDKIVQTRNITQSAIGDRDGLWTTVVTAAVFVNLPTTDKQPGSRRSRNSRRVTVLFATTITIRRKSFRCSFPTESGRVPASGGIRDTTRFGNCFRASRNGSVFHSTT